MSEGRPSDGPSWIEAARTRPWCETLARSLAFRKRELIVLAVVVLFIVGGAGFAFVRALPRSPGAAPAARSPHASASAATSGLPSPSPSAGPVVYVAGAVKRVGVYRLDAGARVIDALKAAGGPAPDADLNVLNLAQLVTDGERLYVPRRGEVPPDALAAGSTASGSGGAPAKVNINTATVSQLDGLPGVGPVLAQRIVDYRTQHGAFHDVKELMNVEGIGQKKFDSLKDFVTV